MRPKKSIYSIIAVIMLSLLISSCARKKVKRVEIDPNFGNYISAFTSGQVPKRSVIRILLANDCARAKEFTEICEETYFRFDPSVKGKTRWVNKRTLEFTPDESLSPGQIYTADFLVSKLVKVPESYKIFQFQFSVMPQNFNVTLGTPETYFSQQPEWQKVRGEITTSDFAAKEDIEKMFKASQDEAELEISWIHLEDINNHIFNIDSVHRKERSSQLIVKWDGDPIDVAGGDTREIDLPGLGEFVVAKVYVQQDPDLALSITFSDPIKSNQDLNGIISMDGVDNLTFNINNENVTVYLPDRNLTGIKMLHVSNGIKNYAGYKMQKEFSQDVYFEEPNPAVRLLGKGTILPNSNGLIFPFETVNLKAVDVIVTRIFEKNIPQFLQVNELDGKYQLRRVGRQIISKKVELNKGGKLNLKQWNKFSVDLKELVAVEPGAIYRVTIKMKKEYSLYDCVIPEENENENRDAVSEATDGESDEWSEADWREYSYDDYYDNQEDEYFYRGNTTPCQHYYFQFAKSRNILASDIGIIAKAGEDKTFHVFTTNLVSTLPLAGVKVEFYDYQQQLTGSMITDKDGMGSVRMDKKPFMLMAKSGAQRGYLKLQDGASLSLSKFDVSGETVQKGIKGFIYGERSVWRPGDSLYLTFVMEDKQNLLPSTYPVSFELLNPDGALVKKVIKKQAVEGFYDFRTSTDEEAPTGNWMARVTVGNRVFNKELKIETIKPNRLKIYLEFAKEKLSRSDKNNTAKLRVKWLHGAIAKNLNAQVDVTVNQASTHFDNFPGFEFDDPVLSFSAEQETVFDGKINNDGEAEINTDLRVGDASPGMLRAYFTTRVTEEGGDFSIDRQSVLYSPYSHYTGLKAPEGKMYRGTLETDKDHFIDIATVNSDGLPVSRSGLKLKVYQLEWRWWWDSYEDDMASYISRPSTLPVIDSTISTVNGKSRFRLRINRPNWGRFYIKITDPKSGHSTGKIIFIDWPYWARANRSNTENASMLNFSSDKQSYITGQNIKLAFPSPSNGRALVCVESGTRIVKKYWVETKKGETKFEFPATPEMAPNVFIHVTLMQPHKATKNDLPIRMYGVIPVLVENPNTHLHPEIFMPDALKPESSASIRVKEKKGLPMVYTLAIVDEGLLDLTRFSTPEPWETFYAREALGIKTWDIYDMVVGAYGGRLDKMLSIGGDEDGLKKKAVKANRFKPMVRFVGPFYLAAGQENMHRIKVPNYVGSVRVMVVAGYKAAYGNAEKTVPVKKPLMVLATLPRVLGPAETVQLPVNVFAMEKHIKSVKVEIEINEFLTIDGSKTKTILFATPGDEVINFKLNVASKTGIAKVKITASCGAEIAMHEIEIDVRASNPKVTDIKETIIEPGKSWNSSYEFKGMEGTNKGTLELSTIPPINLQKRLDYLLTYPHGCIEQTTSSVFPQIALGNVMELNSNYQKRISYNIQAGINRLRLFQTSDGGLAYWPGQPNSDEWGSSYGGHFLMEAEKRGYTLPHGMKGRWVKYQQKRAKTWTDNSKNSDFHGHEYSEQLEQAYRLYTLALAGSPELGAMNRLRELPALSTTASWRLAAAYQLIGQREVAMGLIKGISTTVKEYKELSYTYGSNIRDEAMILETLSLLKEKAQAMPVAIRVAKSLAAQTWLSTQETAYSLLALSSYIGSTGTSNTMKFTVSLNNTNGETRSSVAPIYQVKLGEGKITGEGKVLVENKGATMLYARIITEGIPVTGDQTAAANNLDLSVSYTTMEGVTLDPAKIIQGTDFIAEVTVTNPGLRGYLEQMALNQIFPSGWEIHNSRMDGSISALKSDVSEYQDIRDDRVYTYYTLRANEKKTFRILLNATYLGKFYLPTVMSEAMYDNSVNARVPGRWVEVIPQPDNIVMK